MVIRAWRISWLQLMASCFTRAGHVGRPAFGGFSLGKADILRRAMGRKMLLKCIKWREEFVRGAVKLGTQRPRPGSLCGHGEFAGYGFSRSHA